LAQLKGVQLISLQKGPGTEQLPALAGRFSVVDLDSERWPDFMETAAIVSNLDLVISVDTAVAHLAGALGVPVWVVVSDISCWPWLMDRDDSPWYPTVRLFRQRERGNWPEVLARIAAELQQAKSK